ncbi:peptide ABC transporter substrate-binding protein [Vagococcus elongatus]|nr:peptide ABC transporter substrate-binding protein [Vagococcus elongatus]
MKKTMTLFAFVLTTMVFLTACYPKKNIPEKTEQGTTEAVVINVTQELNTLDPANSVDVNTIIVINNVYEGLYRLDAGNQPLPAGAVELPAISEDGLTYTIKLRKEAKWSNETPVTAHDYVFAWQRAHADTNAGENAHLFSSIKNSEAIIFGDKPATELGISAIDDYTLKVELTYPTPYFTALLASSAFFPLNEAYVKEQGKEFGANSEQAIYNGPFVLAEFAGPGSGSNWEYHKNPAYWDQESVKTDTIKVNVVKEISTNVSLFESGETDDVNITGEFVKNNLDNPAFVSEKPVQTIFIGYNHTKDFFRNKKIRQAVSLVVDRREITDNLLNNGAVPASGLIFDGLYSHSETGEDFAKASGNVLKMDVSKAKQLWLEGKKELGLSETDEVPIHLITFESEDMRKMGEYLQAVFKEHLPGAKIEASVYPTSVFMESAAKQDFDLYLVSWGVDYPDPTSLFQLFQSSVAHNWGKYNSQAYDEALRKANEDDVLDVDKRWDDLLTAEKILMEEQGVTPLYFSGPNHLRNPKLKGVKYHNAGPRFEYKAAYLEP